MPKSLLKMREDAEREAEEKETIVRLLRHMGSWTVVMGEKLIENVSKGGPEGWLEDDVDALFERVTEELQELRKAIKGKRHSATIRREAADVANMVFMVADAYRERYDPPKSNPLHAVCSSVVIDASEASSQRDHDRTADWYCPTCEKYYADQDL